MCYLSHRAVLLLTLFGPLASLPVVAGNSEAASHVVEVRSEWHLSGEDAQVEADAGTHWQLAELVSQGDGREPAPRLRRLLARILADDAVIRDTRIETRRRAYGEQFRSTVTISIPNNLLDRSRAEWENLRIQHERMTIGLIASLPVLFGCLYGIFVVLDRRTLGDRRPILTGLMLLVCILIGASAHMLLHWT